MKKDSFSGPGYLIAAAKLAAGVPQGREFSPWLVDAIREKLEREHPGLIESTRRDLQSLYPETESEPAKLVAEPNAAARQKYLAAVAAESQRRELEQKGSQASHVQHK